MESLLLGFTINGISNFPIVNFPFLSSNIPSAPAYSIYVSQLIRYARKFSNYQDFMEPGKVLTTKLLSQGYQTRGPWWPCNAHLSIIALWEPDLELIKANILIKIKNDYINK